MAEKAAISLSIGDHVRLKTVDSNMHKSYMDASMPTAPLHAPLDGLVLSIRDISTGKLQKQSKGDARNYVIELLVDTTFSPRYASQSNAPRGTERPNLTPGWRRIRAALRENAEKGQLVASTPELFADSALAPLLDGWKVVKIWSDQISDLEPAKSEETATE
ncbi:MAG TPA: hypothetical protein VGM23_09395 [Armatimonadota bacterium]|jgi:hypothetical protein